MVYPEAMGMRFDCSTDNIWLHLKNIYDSGELEEKATTEKTSVVRHPWRRLFRTFVSGDSGDSSFRTKILPIEFLKQKSP